MTTPTDSAEKVVAELRANAGAEHIAGTAKPHRVRLLERAADALEASQAREAAAEARVTALEAEIARLRAALEWYAGDGSTYDGIDVGQRARAALSRSTEKNDG